MCTTASGIQNPGFSEQVCLHGECLRHTPIWTVLRVATFRVEAWLGIKKRVWTERCCGRVMERGRMVEVYRCAQCGRLRESPSGWLSARCDCCGRLREAFNHTYDM